MDLKAFKKAAREGIENAKPKRIASGEVPKRKPWEAVPRCTISGCFEEAFHILGPTFDLCDHHFALQQQPFREETCDRCKGNGVIFPTVALTPKTCPKCSGNRVVERN